MTTPGPSKNPTSAESKLEQGIKNASIPASGGSVGKPLEAKKNFVENKATSGTAAADAQKAQKDAAKPPKKEAAKDTAEEAKTASSSTLKRKNSAAQ